MQTMGIHIPRRLPVILITPISVRPSIPKDVPRVDEDQDRENDIDYETEDYGKLDEDHDDGEDEGDECLRIG